MGGSASKADGKESRVEAVSKQVNQSSNEVSYIGSIIKSLFRRKHRNCWKKASSWWKEKVKKIKTKKRQAMW